MYLVAIAWLYVALMMSVAEAMHPAGTVLGAIVTFLLYGLLPTSVIMYIMGTPLRQKERRRQEAVEQSASAGLVTHSAGEPLNSPVDPDTGGHASGAAQTGRIPPV